MTIHPSWHDKAGARQALTLVLLVPVALLVTLVLAWSDPGRVPIARDPTPDLMSGYGLIPQQAEPGMVLTYGYGFPLDWLLQNAPYDLPNELPLRDPREVQTAVAWGALGRRPGAGLRAAAGGAVDRAADSASCNAVSGMIASMTGRVSLYARLICPLVVLFLVGSWAVAAQPDEFIARGTVCEDESNVPRLWVGADDLMLPPQCDGVDVVGWDWSKVKGGHKLGRVRWGYFVVIGSYNPSARTLTLTRSAVPADAYQGPGFDDPEEEWEASFATPCEEPTGGWRVIDPTLTNHQTMERTMRAAGSRRDFGQLWLDQSINPADAAFEANNDDEAAERLLNDPTKLILNVAVTGDVAAAEADLRKTWGGSLCVRRVKHTERELRRIQHGLAATEPFLSVGVIDDFVEIQVEWDDGSLQSKLDKQYGRGKVKVTSAIRPLEQ